MKLIIKKSDLFINPGETGLDDLKKSTIKLWKKL